MCGDYKKHHQNSDTVAMATGWYVNPVDVEILTRDINQYMDSFLQHT